MTRKQSPAPAPSPGTGASGSVGAQSHRPATPSVEILSAHKLPWPGIDVTITFARIHSERPS